MAPDTQVMNTIFTIVGFMSSVASLILSVVAIGLSIVFFRMASSLSQTTTEAAKGIGASVERLEKLFDKLYADTFSMMKDTVSDMRKHIWPEDRGVTEDLPDAIERKADEKVGRLKEEMDAELTKLLQGQKNAEASIGSLRKEMGTLIDKAIKMSRRVEIEAREETIRDRILTAFHTCQDENPFMLAHELLDKIGKCSPSRLYDELKKLETEGVVDMPDLNSEGDFSPSTKIRLRRQRTRVTHRGDT